MTILPFTEDGQARFLSLFLLHPTPLLNFFNLSISLFCLSSHFLYTLYNPCLNINLSPPTLSLSLYFSLYIPIFLSVSPPPSYNFNLSLLFSTIPHTPLCIFFLFYNPVTSLLFLLPPTTSAFKNYCLSSPTFSYACGLFSRYANLTVSLCLSPLSSLHTTTFSPVYIHASLSVTPFFRHLCISLPYIPIFRAC
ncbi:unnamed protein product [Acanthosepion pharaonis]|uniref:Uncharacterized protein n=1 Tax=Acanthosepion pharaonis TaxID=158019 RepID=A0A812ESE6_ACAPH|nr:unnamed protein product [Sepia pharaonis]